MDRLREWFLQCLQLRVAFLILLQQIKKDSRKPCSRRICFLRSVSNPTRFQKELITSRIRCLKLGNDTFSGQPPVAYYAYSSFLGFPTWLQARIIRRSNIHFKMLRRSSQDIPIQASHLVLTVSWIWWFNQLSKRPTDLKDINYQNTVDSLMQ